MKERRLNEPGNNTEVALVTGASSGIGRATAIHLAKAGYTVYGTSRSPRTLAGVTMMIMDAGSDADAAHVAEEIFTRHGRLDILVANAGTGIAGAVEETGIALAKTQFDTNYFGALRIIRAVLPGMRSQGGGCIIGVSSVAALLPIPFQAGYSASKAAMEATLCALRGEVRPFGIRISLVEPGDTKTGFTDARSQAGPTDGNSPYAERFSRSLSRMEKDERNGVSPDKVAAVICRVVRMRRPPIRVAVGADYRFLLWLRRLLPDRLVQWLLERMYAS